MNEIEPKKKTLDEMLRRQKYRLEYYQRDYAWTEDEITDLAEDFIGRFNQQYECHGNRVEDYAGYFLGTIITSREGDNDGNNRKAIIDGQQRLTTITLLLIHLNSRRGTSPLFKDNRNLDEYIYAKKFHNDRESYNIDVQNRRSIFQEFRESKDPITEGKKPAIKNLIERNKDIKREFAKQALPDDKLDLFIDWILHKIYVVEISTGSTNTAYEIFTTVNDRGLGLTAAEMLKGYVLSKVNAENELESLKVEWNKTIDNLHRLASRTGNSQLKNAQKEEAQFFQAWIRSRYGDDDKDFMTIGSQFHRWFQNADTGLKNQTDVKDFIKGDLNFYAQSYIDVRERTKKWCLNNSSFFFNGIASFTLQYPLVLAVVTKDDQRRVALRKMSMVARYIEIMLARRMWARLPISQREMLPVIVHDINKIRSCKVDELPGVLNKLLEEAVKGKQKAPLFSSDMDLRLHGQNRPTVKRLLARMTEWVQTKAQGDPLTFHDLMGNSYHIEHLWGTDVQVHREPFESDSEYQRERHRVGALVLIKEATNESLGGRSYEDKLKAYSRENLLAASLALETYKNNPRLKTFIKDNDLANMASMQSFGKEELEKRTELYVKIAKLCWAPDF